MDTTKRPPDGTPARLGVMLIDAMRLIRTLRAEDCACSELVQLALEMERARDAELDRFQRISEGHYVLNVADLNTDDDAADRPVREHV